MHTLVFAIVVLVFVSPVWANDRPLRIGVTLHPYFAWVANITDGRAEVVPVLPADQDPHSYQPRPEEMLTLKNLDVIVVNGIGHDQFLEPMLAAVDFPRSKLINPHKGVALLGEAGDMDRLDNVTVTTVTSNSNSHSFLSVTAAVAQIYNIAEALGRVDRTNLTGYHDNARGYVRRLRRLLADALAELDNLDTRKARIATVHDGYRYLLQDLGLEANAVFQPRHGIEPSAKQLADTIQQVKRQDVNILFAEIDYGQRVQNVLIESTGARIYSLSHISRGDYTAEKFTDKMAKNYATIIRAIREAQ